MKNIFGICLVLLTAVPAFAENYLLNGGQASKIEYQMLQKVQPSSNTKKLMLSYVVPEQFKSPTYRQEIKDLEFNFNPVPSQREEKTDKHGNKIVVVTWNEPLETVTASLNFVAINSVNLQTLDTNAPFPANNLPEKIKIYLEATEQVASEDALIKRKADNLTESTRTQFDAVQKILTWVVDHMHYVLNPKQYDALYSFKSGKGNCQNYSHLSAALMRAAGIPVRIVNGVTLNKPYDIKKDQSILTVKMAQGRHSWIEVYFPDLGWMPFDPQGSQLFVSNRFIRVEVGLDNNETEQDGLMRWTRMKGTEGRPQLTESIDAEFVSDEVRLTGRKTDYGPRGMLLSPEVNAAFSKVAYVPPPLPPQVTEKEMKLLEYTEPYIFGNLEFPKNLDFLSARGPAQEEADGSMKMKKNFLVETAEYVTTKGQQYAQTFILEKPMKLEKIGLALHMFSSEGQLWLELLKDDEGKPADIIATSDFLILNQMQFSSGYSWVDFDFKGSSVVLSPGRYWIALGFTGSPIVNWFFTYGKPVGPLDGTRYKVMFDVSWNRSLVYEFNYRVAGLAAKEMIERSYTTNNQ